MTRTHVLLTLVTQQLDVSSAMLFVMITTDVLLTGVTDKPDKSNTNQSLALIKMHVPSTCAQRRRVDATISTSHVTTTTHVPLILVMSPLDNVSSLQSLATTTMHAPSILVMSPLESARTD
jgi:hypothetical protein